MLNQIRIVLVNTSHPGNIGAAARAMKNMGLTQLYLVEPVEFPHKNATIRASGADDILAGAVQCDTLAQAIAECELVFGTSARSRSLPWPLCNPRECAQQITRSPASRIALVFGRERTGLTNEELAMCHYHVHIPTQEHFSSLNLGAAVQVLSYEMRMASLASNAADNSSEPADDEPLASAGEVNGLIEHLTTTMTDVDFLDPNHPKLLVQRLQRLFNRVLLEQKEVNILRGFLSAITRKLQGGA